MDCSSVFVVFCVAVPPCSVVLAWDVCPVRPLCGMCLRAAGGGVDAEVDVLAVGWWREWLTIIDGKVKHYDKKG